MCKRCDNLLDTLQQILQWSQAYQLLTVNGTILDEYSASFGHRALKGISGIVEAALDADEISRFGTWPVDKR